MNTQEQGERGLPLRQRPGSQATSLAAEGGTHGTSCDCRVPQNPTSTHSKTQSPKYREGDPEPWVGDEPGSPPDQGIKHTESKPHTTAKKPQLIKYSAQQEIHNRIGRFNNMQLKLLVKTTPTDTGKREMRSPCEALTLPRRPHPGVPTPHPFLTLIKPFRLKCSPGGKGNSWVDGSPGT